MFKCGKSLHDCLAATQAFFKNGGTPELFEANHGIKWKSDGKHLMLDYNQIEVKWTEPYGYVCRGLILDAVTFEPICMGLAKFHNFGDTYADDIDWSSAKTFEKIDGTMVNRWWSPHTNKFEFSTRFQLPPSLLQNYAPSGVLTWQDLIERCLESVDLSKQPKDETWTFEVCSSHNMVVVRHQGFYAKLLAIRNITTLEEREIEREGLPPAPKSYKFNSGKDVTDFANTHQATQLEGFVVTDKNFNRIKIKSDDYVRLHRLKDGLNGIYSIILLARDNDYEEIVLHFPEYKADLDAVANLIALEIEKHEKVYEENKHIESQKDFAIKVVNEKLSHQDALFSTRSGKSLSVRHSFLSMTDSKMCKIFKEPAQKILKKSYSGE